MKIKRQFSLEKWCNSARLRRMMLDDVRATNLDAVWPCESVALPSGFDITSNGLLRDVTLRHSSLWVVAMALRYYFIAEKQLWLSSSSSYFFLLHRHFDYVSWFNHFKSARLILLRNFWLFVCVILFLYVIYHNILLRWVKIFNKWRLELHYA